MRFTATSSASPRARHDAKLSHATIPPLHSPLPLNSPYLLSAPTAQDKGFPTPSGELSLETFLQQKVGTLATLLAAIELQIQDRMALSRQLLDDIREHYAQTHDLFADLRFCPLSLHTGVDGRRRSLEQQLDMLRREHRQEHVRRWEHIALLQQELRQWTKQYADLRVRIALVLTLPPQATRQEAKGTNYAEASDWSQGGIK